MCSSFTAEGKFLKVKS